MVQKINQEFQYSKGGGMIKRTISIKPELIFTCPFCFTHFSGRSAIRWHFNRCENKIKHEGQFIRHKLKLLKPL